MDRPSRRPRRLEFAARPNRIAHGQCAGHFASAVKAGLPTFSTAPLTAASTHFL